MAAKRGRDPDGAYAEAAEGEYSSEEEEELERELAEIPFGELLMARADGSRVPLQKRPRKANKLGRANKNRPMEMSSKVPVGRFRELIQAPKKVVRDPRFESLCGSLDGDGFKKRYSFLYDVELPTEKEKLQTMVKKSKDPQVIEELKQNISWIDKQLKSGSSKNADAEILVEHKKKEREAAKRGKQPFYLKKSKIREHRLLQKYNELKASGKLEAFMEKKRKKNASKDARFLPYRRADDGV
uniref:rRNA biogenesis protein RRP36 n=1 Tax=Anthurium amnicola TaxID=1678845 RepID=A0A1D1ZHB8_9ARAE